MHKRHHKAPGGHDQAKQGCSIHKLKIKTYNFTQEHLNTRTLNVFPIVWLQYFCSKNYVAVGLGWLSGLGVLNPPQAQRKPCFSFWELDFCSTTEKFKKLIIQPMVGNRSSLALFVYCSWLRLSLALRLIHCQSFAQHFSGRNFFPLPTNTKYKIGWHKTQNEPGNMINSICHSFGGQFFYF